MSELTTRQAATLLNVSVRSVQLWVESGVLQAWKTAGGHRRISVGSIQQLLDEKHEKQTPIRRPSTKGPVTVLIVDDNKDTLLLYKMLINNWFPSLQVETAENGIDALVKIGEFKPTVLITDLQMPQLDGFAIIERLQNDPKYDHLTPIVVTSVDEAEVAASNLPHNVSVLRKPIPVEELKELVLQAVKN
jgi:excisionase family DNA binding protein|tara:strand:+ start:4419 stop:4988 length:570 start_codon:yes stop_codon:yes gene_type:complete